MQKTGQIFIILASSILLAACNSKKNSSPEERSEEISNEVEKVKENGSANPLEGAWEIKRAEGSMVEANLGTVYEFKGSKLTFGKDGFLNPGTTEVTDSTFSFQAEGNGYKFMYNYRFNGDTLVVEMQKGMGQVFHMLKK